MKNVKKNTNIKNQGSGNGKWTGGVSSYYTNHYQLKLNRKEKLKQIGNKCEKCGRGDTKLDATRKDGDRNNHDIDNLIMLCSLCKTNKDSKYKRKYGHTLKELSKIYNVPLSTIHNKYISKYKTKEELIGALEKI